MPKLKTNILIFFFLLVYYFGFAQGIEIGNGASIVSEGSTSIEIVDGDFFNDGIYSMGTGNLCFSGTVASSILGLSNNDFYQLIVNNVNGVSLSSTGYVAVNSILNFTSGLIYTHEKVLIINDNATVMGYDATRYIDGNCRKVGDDAFLFPIGNAGQYAPLSITAPLDLSDHFTVSYYHQDPSDDYDVASLTGGLNNVSTNEYWTCERTNGSSNVSIQLHWESAELSGISDYTDDLVVSLWNGTAWENCGNTAITEASTGAVTSISTGTFGPFTFGSLTAAINILPISLVYFDAELEGGLVELEWETSSEINNDYFAVERSSDGLIYEKLGTVLGFGNSSASQYYTFIDETPLGAVSYYRLKQVDYDGRYVHYPPKRINFHTSVLRLLAYPNPVEDYVNISYNLSNGIYANSIAIYDMYGQTILFQDILKIEDVIKLDISQLNSGSYIVALMLGAEFINSIQLLVK